MVVCGVVVDVVEPVLLEELDELPGGGVEEAAVPLVPGGGLAARLACDGNTGLAGCDGWKPGSGNPPGDGLD